MNVYHLETLTPKAIGDFRESQRKEFNADKIKKANYEAAINSAKRLSTKKGKFNY